MGKTRLPPTIIERLETARELVAIAVTFEVGDARQQKLFHVVYEMIKEVHEDLHQMIYPKDAV